MGEGTNGVSGVKRWGILHWDSVRKPSIGKPQRPRNKAKKAKERGGREWKGPFLGCMAGQGAEKQGPGSVSSSVKWDRVHLPIPPLRVPIGRVQALEE